MPNSSICRRSLQWPACVPWTSSSRWPPSARAARSWCGRPWRRCRCGQCNGRLPFVNVACMHVLWACRPRRCCRLRQQRAVLQALWDGIKVDRYGYLALQEGTRILLPPCYPQELFVKVLLPDRKLKFLEQQPLQVRAPPPGHHRRQLQQQPRDYTTTCASSGEPSNKRRCVHGVTLPVGYRWHA